MRMAASRFLDTRRLHTGLGDVAPFTLLIRVLSAPLYVLVVPVSVSSSSSKLAGSLRTFPQAFLSGSFLFFSFTIYLFGAVLGLCSWADFSLVANSESDLWRTGFSLRRLPGWQGVGRRVGTLCSVVAAPGLCGTGWIVVGHGPSCSAACGILPGGDRTRVSCIGSRFFITEPPGKS